ncbi:MAG: tetratricopeptide repeat protein [Methanoregula sp.]|nr:tetratricopeptide repeat protein [Methanoregula sp.]
MNFRFVTVCVIVLLFVSGLVNAAETSTELQSAGALYSKSVDLANEGKYKEALQAADQALALNVSSLMPVIQANRAGILTVIGRYDEALIAADAALASEGNLTTTHSIAWYNKGDALRHLGRVDEAKTAFARAQALDPTLLPPKDLIVIVTPVPTTAKSPLPWTLAAGALALVFIIGGVFSRSKR